MEMQPQDQTALSTTAPFVQTVAQVGLSTAMFARPISVLVQMGMRPQEQVVHPTMLQSAHRVMQVTMKVGMLIRHLSQSLPDIAILLGIVCGAITIQASMEIMNNAVSLFRIPPRLLLSAISTLKVVMTNLQ
jgi:hypothetical protein